VEVGHKAKEPCVETIRSKKTISYRETVYIDGVRLRSPTFERKSDAKNWKNEVLSQREKAKILGSLKMGQALLVSSKVDPHFCIMKIHLAKEYSSEYVKISKGISETERSQYSDIQGKTEALQPEDLF